MNNFIKEIVLFGDWDGEVRFERCHSGERVYTPTEARKERLEEVLANKINSDRAKIYFCLPLIFIEPT